MVDASGTNVYMYDAMGQLTNRVVAFASGLLLALSYAYDAAGSLTNLHSAYDGGVSNTYACDLQGRLTNVLANGNAAAGYGFDAVGNLQSMTYGNGVTNLCQYDALNRLTNEVWKTGGTALASFAYTVGPAGNRATLAETVNGTSRGYNWAYDYLYRLTGETLTGGTTGTVTYGYDSVGNRTNRTSTVTGVGGQSLSYTPNDWLTSDSYDPNGNTTNSTGTAYRYDPLNHLTNANNGAILLTYDGDGNRVIKAAHGATNYYLIDDRNPSGYAQVLEEWTASGGTTNLSQVYNYGMALVSQRQAATPTNLWYFVTDGHGSTRLLADNSASVANAFAYDAYGTLIASNGLAQTAYLYCGQQFDGDLGLSYNRARYLSMNTGRFWTMDTYQGEIDDPQTLHKYLYVNANPINQTDLLGFTWQTDFGSAVERVVREDFYSKDRTHRYENEVALSTLLGMPYIGAYRQRLDLAHEEVGANYFYEIKHCTPIEIAKGYLKIAGYQNVLGPSWRRGTSSDYQYQGKNGFPLIKNDINGLPLPGNYYALVIPPIRGLITYIRVAPNTPQSMLEEVLDTTVAAAGEGSAMGAAETTEALAAAGETATGMAEAGALAAEVGPAVQAITGAEVGAATLTTIEGAP